MSNRHRESVRSNEDGSLAPSLQSLQSSRDSGSRWSSGGGGGRRPRPPPSPRLSVLQSTASLGPSSFTPSSESSGVLAYHPRTGSVQYEWPTDSSRGGSPMSPRGMLPPAEPTHPAATQQPTSRRRRYQRSCWRRLRQTCWKRVPRGPGSLIVFLLNVLESFAFYGAIDGTLRILFKGPSWKETALVLLVKFTAGRLLYPIAGLLSDVYTGRYAMVQIGIGLFWTAFTLLSLFLALASGHIGGDSMNTLGIPIVAYALICAASGAIEVVIIPFGVDQLSQGASSHEQSSYFYFFYFGRQLGNLAGMLSFYGLSLLQIEEDATRNQYAVASIQSLSALIGMTLALVLIWWFKNFLFRDKQRENPLKEVVNIVLYAATVRDTPPVTRRAFRYGEGRKKRMERAKSRYDGLYTSEEVEDVKTFCKILLVLFSLGLCFMTYTGVYVLLEYELTNVYQVELAGLNHFPNVTSLWNALTILIAIPIINFLLLPSLPSWTMRERIGFGVGLIALSALLGAYIEWCVFPLMSVHHQLLWLVLPIITVSVGEILLFVNGLEFIYAQSPEQMKGVLTGLFYLVFGLFSGAACLFFFFYPVKDNQFHSHACYFTIYAVIGTIGFVMYLVVACLYSNRDRPEEDDFLR